NNLVTEIAAASKEQSQGIDQVSTAVQQMDTVTQTNAANAEESASAAEELSSQAEELNGMVAELEKIVKGAASAQAHASDSSNVSCRKTSSQQVHARREQGEHWQRQTERPRGDLADVEQASDTESNDEAQLAVSA
ncbi:MAG: methyl-accepting chemotaxis protein, partial [Phycisphaerae bacterium]|nr:methyl-accepting chemotaxis protein [Phycisphaerae bacterium]